MAKYLNTLGESNLAVAICPRCQFKVKYTDLVEDPNNKLRVCPKCKDLYDPYRLPVRKADRYTLQYPRPDEELVNPDAE